MSTETIEILSKKFGITNQTYSITGSRFSNQIQMFHSKSYRKKKNSNSYTIEFSENGSYHYGEILEFFELNSEFYALVNTFKICKTNLPLSNSYFYDVIKNKNLFDRFFTSVNTNEVTLDIILCKNITYKCIVVRNTIGQFITKIKYEYEHD